MLKIKNHPGFLTSNYRGFQLNKYTCAVLICGSLMAGNALAADVDPVSRALDVYTSDYYAGKEAVSTEKNVVVASAASVAPAPAPMAEAPAAAMTGTALADKINRPKHEFSFGVERYQYKYHEYDSDGAKFMHLRGYYNGLYSTYTFRPADVDSVIEQIVSFYRAELRYATGRVNYTGGSSDAFGNVTGFTFNGVKDYTYEVRGLLGKEYALGHGWAASPYAGLGWRYLNDGAQVMPGGYNRESKYLYLPLGIDVSVDLPAAWSLVENVEFDWLIKGSQTSHLEDLDSSLRPLVNDQRKGFGWRTSLKVVKAFPHMKFSIEPYYRFWHIQKSSVEPWSTQDGSAVAGPIPGTIIVGWEPDNITQEAGVKLGAQF